MKIREITLIIICAFFCISASVVSKNIMVTEPKQPMHSVVYDGDNPSDFYLKYAKNGYTVHTCVRGGYNRTFIVMAKY